MSKIIDIVSLYEQKARQGQKHNFAKFSTNFNHTRMNRTSAAAKDVKRKDFLYIFKTYR